jgi:hypothetical protein
MKRFLAEDHFWTEDNNEDAISLISSTSEETKFQKYVKHQNPQAQSYPLLFLPMFIVTNVIPVLVTCANDPVAPRCMSWSSTNAHPFLTFCYQV